MITAHDIEKLARLSALEVLPHELEGLIQHLTSVLEYASRVEHIVQFEQELLTPDTANTVRPDQEQPSDPQALRTAFPASAQHFIVVPRIIEG